MKRVLIVEDDEHICQLLESLFQADYKLTIVQSGTEAVLKITENDYELVLLDLMLPGITGESVLQMIKKKKAIPVIVMTAVDDKRKTVELLKNGADDYITKPFDIEELAVRMEIQLRKTVITELKTSTRTFKNLSINSETYEAMIVDQLLDISHKEFQILSLLVDYPSKIYSKANLYERIWGDSYIGGENTVNVHISTLRKKLSVADPDNEYIETIWGMGIRLAKEA